MKKSSFYLLFSITFFSGLTALHAQNIGLGTASPTAKLHVNGTVRFENLPLNNSYNTVLGMDALGNLVRKSADFWSLTGNAGVNPATQYVGTSDNNDLVLKVNGAERGRFTTNGAFTVGGATANNVVNTGAWSTFIAGSGNTINFAEKSVVMGWQNTANTHNQYLIGVNNAANFEYDFTWGIDLQGDAQKTFLIGTGNPGSRMNNNIPNSLVVGFNGNKALFVNSSAVSLFTTAPTQRFHVKCDSTLFNGGIRFENLPEGTGYYLTVDHLGNVKRSSIQSTARFSETEAEDIKGLRRELDELRKEMELLKKQLSRQPDGNGK